LRQINEKQTSKQPIAQSMTVPHVAAVIQASSSLERLENSRFSRNSATKHPLNLAKNNFQTLNPELPQDNRFRIDDPHVSLAANRYEANKNQSNLLRTEAKLGSLLKDQRSRLSHLTDMLITAKQDLEVSPSKPYPRLPEEEIVSRHFRQTVGTK